MQPDSSFRGVCVTPHAENPVVVNVSSAFPRQASAICTTGIRGESGRRRLSDFVPSEKPSPGENAYQPDGPCRSCSVKWSIEMIRLAQIKYQTWNHPSAQVLVRSERVLK